MSFFTRCIEILFIIYISYFLLLVVYQVILGVIGFFENRWRNKQDEAEDYNRFSVSAFSLPVSFIVPARNEQEWISECIKAILSQDYPEFEVIVVNDNSTDQTMNILNELLDLQELTNPYKDRFDAGKIIGMHRSRKYPKVTVLTKISGKKKAGALNAGLNFAKYKYVCILDADTIIEPNALLRIMSHVQKEPDNIIGIGSSFGLVNGFKVKDGKIVDKSYSYNPLLAYQNIEYIRSFIGNRIAWSRFNSSPNIAGGFGIWRRDILLELGGYSTDFTCEDIELTFRAQDFIIKNKKGNYKILMMPYFIGWTEGPSNISGLILQRSRWQRVTNETVSYYRHMFMNPQFKMFAFVIMPYFLLYEVLGVFFEVSSIGLVLFGWWSGWLDVRMFLALFSFMVLTQTLVSLVSIGAFFREEKLFKLRDIILFVFLSFFETFWYRWIISLAKLWGTFGYLLGQKHFDQYERSKVKTDS
ncbi:MAG: glycosyltransferase [bacterium]|nr:glycosyltransferase [bacterium]MDD5757218.1 glycosyltransferase [bacterium]